MGEVVLRPVTGIGVSPGVAHGPVARLAEPPRLPEADAPEADVPAAVERARAALAEVAAFLDERSAQAGGAAADVLLAQSMMVADPALVDRIRARLEDGRGLAHAVADAFAGFRDALTAAGGYLAERAADVDDLRDRTVARILGVPMPGVPDPGHPFVLVARDLAPADTAVLDADQVRAIVTELGGPTSHTAILAKSLGIPAVVACAGAASLTDGTPVLVRGATGEVVVDPPDSLVEAAEAEAAEHAAALAASSGPGRTADGVPVALLVNVGAARDLAAAAAADSEGVGLLRTEFLYLDRADEPSVEEQRRSYAEVFQAFGGRKVVVRTLDAGADKPLAFVDHGDEPNPALGVRGLRLARRHPRMLADQLTAIAAARDASTADVWVMAPMVSTQAEAAEFAAAARAHGLPVAGTMVEVPAAALRTDAILGACDFVSIGTNDLGQHTFAADRMAGELAGLLDPWQPALLELVRLTGAAGTAAGKPVGVCGEAASDPLLALVLVGLGVTSLSMAPSALPAVRLALAAHTAAECAELAQLALSAPDAASARERVAAAAGAG
ncbi:phosphoenolpyruvate--protein phosphotransferase [Amycolatopsis tucumanensis]|uniref:Phosphoenolpyruvate-protein phosphotransferase n=1 Tax=Amycolatopsis tucumanensis TaxID=401106 RepID=A0ABP7IHU9_9PSEU|nr:phosphoenolpyruvate--protein phosphotransferase [Amycolatopsis tucumanensis]MCF6425695.1 phosphoenolpyruvate--protein phosphotransferase [Amycolatopsis tucumanensis]